MGFGGGFGGVLGGDELRLGAEPFLEGFFGDGGDGGGWEVEGAEEECILHGGAEEDGADEVGFDVFVESGDRFEADVGASGDDVAEGVEFVEKFEDGLILVFNVGVEAEFEEEEVAAVAEAIADDDGVDIKL